MGGQSSERTIDLVTLYYTPYQDRLNATMLIRCFACQFVVSMNFVHVAKPTAKQFKTLCVSKT